MAMVGAAATTEYKQVRQTLVQLPAQVTKFLRVAIVQFFGLIEFGMTQPRRVGADAPDSLCPLGVIGERRAEVIKMGAVHHVISGPVVACFVYGPNSILKGHAGWQPAIGLRGEADH